MTALYDRADSLRAYLTGASSDGGTQSSADASLGNYASSSLVGGLVTSVSSPISGITVVYVSPECATGTGTLAASGSTALTWAAPGGSTGPAVAISNGVTVVLEDGSDSGAYIVVSSSTSSVTGSASVALSIPADNAISMEDAAPSETTSGSVRYRAIMLKNVNSVLIANVYAYIAQIGSSQISAGAQLGASGVGTLGISSGSFDTAGWPASGFAQIYTSGGTLREIIYYSSRTASTLTVPSGGRALLGTTAAAGASTDTIYSTPGIRIASETPSPNPGPVQTIANDTTQPSGRTWKTGVTTALGVSIGSMAAGAEMGLWIERTLIAGTQATANALYGIKFQFDAA